MRDPLGDYRSKRDAARTPEPVPRAPKPPRRQTGDRFVIQQHHARRLHWDFRLERDGVLVSWAIPRGIPLDPDRNHLAVHTEDHPLEYADFSGEIPAGEYGAGTVRIFDRGTYTTEKWRDDEVMVVLRGERVSGRYVLFRTRGDDWMIHRMDPPPDGWQPMPDLLRPMLASSGQLPHGADWGYEMWWNGLRAIGYVSGGRLVLRDHRDADVTARYPELRDLAEHLAPTECVLDGEIVGMDATGRLDPEAVRVREQVPESRLRGLVQRRPVVYLVYDLMYADGERTTSLPYQERRRRLDALGIAGERWQVPPYFPGDADATVAASREQGLPGVVAKRLESRYHPGERSKEWVTARNRGRTRRAP